MPDRHSPAFFLRPAYSPDDMNIVITGGKKDKPAQYRLLMLLPRCGSKCKRFLMKSSRNFPKSTEFRWSFVNWKERRSKKRPVTLAGRKERLLRLLRTVASCWRRGCLTTV